MIRQGLNGFLMALADSVPGVSGGTVAFIMGFYDNFIGAIDDLMRGNRVQKKAAAKYLAKLGIGWAIGMVLAVLILSSLFENHIYKVSSLFIGFIAGAIPLIVIEEKNHFRKGPGGILFLVAGMLLVIMIGVVNGNAPSAVLNLERFSAFASVKLFLIGALAVSAMFLPGVSGSTMLLIFGAYIPVISAIKSVITLNFQALPSLLCFAAGILFGVATVVKVIRTCLKRYRSQTLHFIIGMMLGSFYAIVMGPTTLSVPLDPLHFESFSIVFCLMGLALVLGLQRLKSRLQ